VIVSGAFIGINNTLTTQAVMLVSPVERPIASSAYGFVRFIGGGLAPFVAGKLAEATSLSVPFYLGGLTFLLAIAVLATGHRLLGAAEAGQAHGEPVSPRLEPVGPVTTGTWRPVIVAVGATADAPAVVEAAAGIARDQHTRLEVVHIRETAVVEEQAIDAEDVDAARAAVTAHLDRLAGHGVPVTGLLLHSVGDHAAAGRVLAGHARDVAARTIAVGRSPRGPLVQSAEGSLTAAVTSAAPCPVVFFRPDGVPQPLTPQSLHTLGGT
jgi:MFS transporter, ACDE family, multidrug resistance protein